MPMVTVAEFASYVQSDVDTATANLLLGLAEGMVAALAVDGLTTPARRAVILEAAGRAYRNPEGVASESVGPFARSFADSARSGVYLTPDERRLVRGGSGYVSVPLSTPADTSWG